MKKKLLCFFKYLFIFILVLIISLIVYLFSLRNISKSYLSEENIRKEIASIDVMDFLKDDGEELESVKELKKELVEVGIPSESIDEVINSSVIKDVTSSIISEGVNFIITGEEPDIINNINSSSIIDFTRDNLKVVAFELQNNRVPGADKLTDERQEEIINKMEEIAPSLEKKVNEVINVASLKIKENENYKKIEDYQNKLNKGLKVVRFFYSDSMTYGIIAIISILSVLLILLVHSYYRYFKFFGLISLLDSIYFFLTGFAVSILKSKVEGNLSVFEKFINSIIDNISSKFNYYTIVFIISAILFMLINILIHFILEYIEDRKFNKI